MKGKLLLIHHSSFRIHHFPSDSVNVRPPDVLVKLKLHAKVEAARGDQLRQLLQVHSPDRRDENRARASFKSVLLYHAARELPVFAAGDDEFDLVAVGAETFE